MAAKPNFNLGPIGPDDVSKLVKAIKKAMKSTPKKTVKVVKSAKPSAESRAQGIAIQRAADAKAIRSSERQMNLIDVSRKKGQGVYQSTTGKTHVVGKEAAASARSKAGAVNASMAKNAKTSAAEHAKLQKAVTNAPDAASKRIARQNLRNFQNKTGHR